MSVGFSGQSTAGSRATVSQFPGGSPALQTGFVMAVLDCTNGYAIGWDVSGINFSVRTTLIFQFVQDLNQVLLNNRPLGLVSAPQAGIPTWGPSSNRLQAVSYLLDTSTMGGNLAIFGDGTPVGGNPLTEFLDMVPVLGPYCVVIARPSSGVGTFTQSVASRSNFYVVGTPYANTVIAREDVVQYATGIAIGASATVFINLVPLSSGPHYLSGGIGNTTGSLLSVEALADTAGNYQRFITIPVNAQGWFPQTFFQLPRAAMRLIAFNGTAVATTFSYQITRGR